MAVGPVWEQDAAGSNPVTRTKKPLESLIPEVLFLAKQKPSQ